MSLRFAHIADTHLGYRQYKLEEREKDFYRAFNKAISKIIKEKVRFVVHSGDLFNDGNPSPKTLIQAIEEFKRLKNLGIDTYIIPGTHDYRVEETIISVLEKLDLVKNLGNKELYKKVGDYFINEGFKKEYDGLKLFLAGLPGLRAKVVETFQKQRFRDINEFDFKIFVFHQGISEISNEIDSIPLNLLPRGFNYYAGGHLHKNIIINKNNYFVVYPGSLEVTSIDEILENLDKDYIESEKKGFYIYDIDNRKIKRVEIETRRFILIKMDIGESTPSEITKKIVDCIKRIDGRGNPILYLKIYGKVKRGSKLDINREIIESVGKSKGFLHIKINMDNLTSEEEIRIFEFKRKSLDEVEKEILIQMGYSEKEIKALQDILNLLGKNYQTELEIRAIQKKVINIIKELFEIQ